LLAESQPWSRPRRLSPRTIWLIVATFASLPCSMLIIALVNFLARLVADSH
jgi:hypothetical protein